MRTQDMGMACRHSSRITNMLGCVFIFGALHMHLGGELPT